MRFKKGIRVLSVSGEVLCRPQVKKGSCHERRRGETVLFPLRIDDTVMDTNEAWAAKLRAQRHVGDFRHWKDHDGYKKSFERVLRDLKLSTELGK